MDTLQLNKINELAREYLRLGIAKGSSDAVEKARFQLAFEAHRTEPEKSPYEALFDERMKQKAAERSERREQERSELSPLDVRKDRYDEFAARLTAVESSHERTMRTQQSRIAQLEQSLESMRSEISQLRSRPAAVHPRTNDGGPIASTIEQTIKGRTVSSEDVAVDKIFYFGNR